MLPDLLHQLTQINSGGGMSPADFPGDKDALGQPREPARSSWSQTIGEMKVGFLISSLRIGKDASGLKPQAKRYRGYCFSRDNRCGTPGTREKNLPATKMQHWVFAGKSG